MTSPSVPSVVAILATEGDVFPPHLIVKIVPVIAIAVILYLGVFFLTDAKSSLQQFGSISHKYLYIALQLALISFLVRAARWHYYLRMISSSVPLRDSLLTFGVGLLLSLSPGKVAEVAKSLLLKEAWQVPVAKSAPVLLAERVTDLVAVLVLGGLGLLGLPHGVAGGLFVLALALVVLALVTVRRLGLATIGLAMRVPFLARRRAKVLTAYGALQDLFAPRPMVIGLALAGIAWGLQSLCVWVIAGAFPEVRLTVGESLVACCGPLLAGALALVPGGLGATEASMAGLLVHLGQPGLTLARAALITVLFRIATFWLAIVLGITALIVWRVIHRRPSHVLSRP